MSKSHKDLQTSAIFIHDIVIKFIPANLHLLSDQLPDDVAILKNAIYDWFSTALDCAEFTFQWECTINQIEETYNHHFQCYIKLKPHNRARCTTLFRRLPAILCKETNPFIRDVRIRPASNSGCHKLPVYTSKESSRVAGPWTQFIPPLDLSKFRQCRDRPSWNACQHWLDSLIVPLPDLRRIIWVYDQKGESGKSTWANYAEFAYAKTALVIHWMQAKDMRTYIVRSGPKQVYIFDLEKNAPPGIKLHHIFYLIEQLKNGVIIDDKYMTPKIFMTTPHVIVLCNEPCPFKHFTQNRFISYVIAEGSEPWGRQTICPTPPTPPPHTPSTSCGVGSEHSQ